MYSPKTEDGDCTKMEQFPTYNMVNATPSPKDAEFVNKTQAAKTAE
jgi:hypothetical protein